MKKEYLTFVSEFGIESLKDLEEDKEIELVIRDLSLVAINMRRGMSGPRYQARENYPRLILCG